MSKIANIRYIRFSSNEKMETPLVRLKAPTEKKGRNPKKHFYPHEVSNYLEMMLEDVDWMDIVTDDVDWMGELATEGFQLFDKNWRVLWFGWRDNKAKGIVVDAASNIKDLEDLLVFTHFDVDTDCMKGFKYVNRLFAPLPIGTKIVMGSVMEVTEEDEGHIQVMRVLLTNGKTITVIYDDMKGTDYDPEGELKAAVDGSVVFQGGAADALDIPKYEVACAVTFHTPIGFGKGHGLVLRFGAHEAGMVVRVFGPKKMVTSGADGKFYFLYNGPLHVSSVPRTDPQAYWNFDFDREELAPKLAEKYINKVFEASKNEHKLRQLFLKYTQSANIEEGTLDLESWALRMALSYGVSCRRHPGVFRKIVRYLMTQILKCEEARIPMDEVAMYASVLPDPYLFGDVTLKPDLEYSHIDEGHVVVPSGMITVGEDIVVYRQPSSNDSEHVRLHTMWEDGYALFMGKDVCFLGRGAKAVLKRLQGADMDDTLVLVYDKIWRDAINLCQYPETAKLEPKSIKPLYTDDSMFLGQRVEFGNVMTGKWNIRHGLYQLDVARNSKGGIGPAVNMEGIDKLLSSERSKAHIFEYLKKIGAPEIYAEWLSVRVPWQAATIASNMELVIDGHVLDATKLQAFGDLAGMIRRFHDGIPADRTGKNFVITPREGQALYPMCMENRIPPARRNRNAQQREYLLVETVMCFSLNRIARMRDVASELFKQMEWDMVNTPGFAGAPEVLDMYPYNDAVYDMTQQVRSIWRESWQPVFEQGVTFGKDNPYSKIQQDLEAHLASLDPEDVKAISVELYREFYGDPRESGRARGYRRSEMPIDENGRRQSYPDALLWTHRLAITLINVMIDAGITGAYVGVNFDPRYRSYSNLEQVAVSVEDGVVYVPGKKKVKVGNAEGQANWERIGRVAKAPNGRYLMHYGILEISAGSDYIQPISF
jgi:hypothetical protein